MTIFAFVLDKGYTLVEGRIEGERSGRTHLLTLISQMSAGEDADKVTQLTDPEVLEAMMKKYGIE